MQMEWLTKRINLHTVEAAHLYEGKPFGRNNPAWERLKGQMVEGDQLWEFSSPADHWQHLCGRAGIALVRDGKILDSLVTMMN